VSEVSVTYGEMEAAVRLDAFGDARLAVSLME
jgi:hypothetical protein